MSLLIKNARILGATKEIPERADVFVSGDKISAVGTFPEKTADEVYDAQGACLSPGFIDVNTDSDHYLSLFDNPSQDDFLRQGITTIIGGNCGSSLAPLIYGSLESIQKWADIRQFNVDWHTVADFFGLLEKKPLGVNFVSLVGHSTIRRALIGEALRDLTKNELVVFTEILRRSLREGAAGFSTGLAYVHSRQAPAKEIEELATLVAKFGGVYATHLRKNGAEIEESIDETVRVAERTGVSTLISHLLPLEGCEEQYERALQTILLASEKNDIHFDMYPFDTSMLPLYTFLPPWVQNGGQDVMVSNLQDTWMRERIQKDVQRIEPENFIVARAPGNESLVGQSLKDLMEVYRAGDAREALVKLMVSTRLKASIHYRNINATLIRTGLAHPRSLVATNAASMGPLRAHEQPERANSTFTKFLEIVESEKFISLEDAVKKITQTPARKFKLRLRGEITEGNFADLTCFKGSEIKCTIVNGKIAMKDNTFRNVFAGRPLKHHAF